MKEERMREKEIMMRMEESNKGLTSKMIGGEK